MDYDPESGMREPMPIGRALAICLGVAIVLIIFVRAIT